MSTPSVLLATSFQHELGSQAEWDEDSTLYQPYEVEQILMPDNANCLSVRVFLKMLNLPLDIKYKTNAEYMSPNGKVPFIKCGQFVIAQLESIIEFVQSKNYSLSKDLNNSEKDEMRTYMSSVNSVFGNAESYIVWCDPDVVPITSLRCGIVYPFPLNHWITYIKKRANKARLNALGWLKKSLDDVYSDVEKCCEFLSDRLGDSLYFFNVIEELETALKEEYENDGYSRTDEDVDNITEIARPNIWQSCLDVNNVENKMDIFDDIFDLPEQAVLREDCQHFVSKLGNNEEDKISVLSDLESILTCHCKALPNRRKYESNNGWIDLLLPLITLKLPRSCMYNLFEAIFDKFIPRHVDSFHLLRLLILYHDPELCNFLDTKKVTPDLYAKLWFQSLFASSCNLTVILSIWDLYFQKGDPFFIFFLALVIIVNDRDLILNLKDETKSKIVEMISLLPSNLTVEDVTDFCALAQYYDSKTPSSFKKELETLLFKDIDCLDKDSKLSQALCLPVSVMELISNSEERNNISDSGEENVRFFLIDCRPAEQYNAGHPPTAFHLDCNLMLQEPNSFSTAVQGLLSCQRQALAANSKAGGEHLCFLGCGELLADQYTHMVVASFLQKHTHYVSLLSGGYGAFHKYLGDSADTYLWDHNEMLCPVCQKENTSSNIQISKKTSEINGHIEKSEKSDIFGIIG
ncbi:hypothetical protein PGB90_006060 [Kerria lacca]